MWVLFTTGSRQANERSLSVDVGEQPRRTVRVDDMSNLHATEKQATNE